MNGSRLYNYYQEQHLAILRLSLHLYRLLPHTWEHIEMKCISPHI